MYLPRFSGIPSSKHISLSVNKTTVIIFILTMAKAVTKASSSHSNAGYDRPQAEHSVKVVTGHKVAFWQQENPMLWLNSVESTVSVCKLIVVKTWGGITDRIYAIRPQLHHQIQHVIISYAKGPETTVYFIDLNQCRSDWYRGKEQTTSKVFNKISRWDVTNVWAYFAICSSSLSLGVPLCTNIPRFILAGSRAQLDIPIKAHFIHGSGFLLPSHPSSRSGCKLYRCIQHSLVN